MSVQQPVVETSVSDFEDCEEVQRSIVTNPDYKDLGETILNLFELKDTESLLTLINYLEKEVLETGMFDESNNTLLHHASIHGYEKGVEALLDKRLNLSMCNDDGWTPFHLASYYGQSSVLQLLLKSGIEDIDQKIPEGLAALHLATDPGSLQCLISHGATIDIRDRNGDTALHRVLDLLRDPRNLTAPSLFKVLLSCDKEERVKQFTKENMTSRQPLDFACAFLEKDIVEDMCYAGAPVNSRSRFGILPLHSAALKGDVGVAKVLLDFDADLDGVDEHESTALHFACGIEGNEQIIEFLLKMGSSVDLQNDDGETALHYACSISNNEKVIRMLLEHQASVNLTNEDGCTALHLAASAGCESAVIILLDHEADSTVMDIEGKRPFDYSANRKVRDLLENSHVRSHLKAIRKAIELDDEPSVAEIIDNNSSVDINLQDAEGETALHYAVEHGNPIIIRHLMEKKASPNVGSIDKGTVLHVAAAKSGKEVIQTLFEGGANLHAKDGDKREPLAVALEKWNWIAARAISDLLVAEKAGNT